MLLRVYQNTADTVMLLAIIKNTKRSVLDMLLLGPFYQNTAVTYCWMLYILLLLCICLN